MSYQLKQAESHKRQVTHSEQPSSLVAAELKLDVNVRKVVIKLRNKFKPACSYILSLRALTSPHRRGG